MMELIFSAVVVLSAVAVTGFVRYRQDLAWKRRIRCGYRMDRLYCRK